MVRFIIVSHGYIYGACTLFFKGQLVGIEIMSAAKISCPVELLKIPVPERDPQFQ